MNKIKENRFLRVLLHVLVWALLFSLPYLLLSGQNFKFAVFLERSWLPLGLYAILFYINYLFLVDSFLFSRRRSLYFVMNLLLIALFVWLRFIAREYVFAHENMNMPKDAPPTGVFIYIDGLSFIIPWIFAITLKIFERWIKTEAEKKETENARLQSELEHLKYQLQPHFFFNSLNNIYALVDISPEQAKVTILALSTLMRYLLYESNIEKISLTKEAEFILKYIELMELRTSGNTVIETNFGTIPPDAVMAPLLLIPLIENAFKHGISAMGQNKISTLLQYENGVLVFETRNKNYPKTQTDRSGSGIGLENIQKRLELIYPGAYTFTKGVTGDEFIARLELTL